MPRTIYACSYLNCSAIFDHLERYDNHLRKHTGEKPFICTHDGCDKQYSRSSHLKRHAETHQQNSYSCTFPGCAKIMRTKATFKKHIKMFHDGIETKKYKCSECSQEFSKNSFLQRHVSTHTGIQPHKCTEPGCDRSFSMPSLLKRHLKRHKGYLCGEGDCKEHFPRWSMLVKHKKEVHKNEKTYPCDICGKVFNYACNLKAHSTMHLEEREVFPCTVAKCKRTYQAKRHLSDHIKFFHETHPYPCPLETCSRFLKSEEELAKHINYRHMPRRRKNKKEKSKRPEFVEILAGFAKGYPKELNPHRSKTFLNQTSEEVDDLEVEFGPMSTDAKEEKDDSLCSEEKDDSQSSEEINELLCSVEKNDSLCLEGENYTLSCKSEADKLWNRSDLCT